ncbi:DUF1565 domain-containing protein [Spirochaeta dissipatitropha]
MKVVSHVVFLLCVVLLISGCLNPLGTELQDSTDAERTSLHVILGADETARTILPAGYSAPELSYSALLTPDGGGPTMQIDDVPYDGILFNDIAAGDYFIEIAGFDADSRAVYASGMVPIVLVAGANSISINLFPLVSGNGGLEVSLTWPPELIDSVSVYWSDSVSELDMSPPLYISENLTIDTVLGELSISTDDSAIPSGTWYLSINLLRGGEVAARIIEAVRIHDYLISEAGFVLPPERISQPPEAPDSAQVELSGPGYFNVTWLDNAITEIGYRLYEGTPGSGTMISTVSAANQIFGNIYAVPGTPYDFYITAYNNFGESDPLVFEVMTIESFSSYLITGAPVLFEEWAPLDVLMDWEPAPGADSYNLYLSQNESLVQTNDPSAFIASYGSGAVDPSLYAAIIPGEQWFWSVEAVNAYGSISTGFAESFTIREAIYIDNLIGDDANNATAGSPLYSITEGVAQARDGETVTVLDGDYLYSEYGLVIDKDIVLQAESSAEIDNTNFDTGPTITMSRGTLRNFSIQPAESDPDPRVSIRITDTQGPVLLENLRVVVDDFGIELPDNGNYQHEIVIRNNRFIAYEGSTSFYAGSGSYAEPIVFDSNQIQILNIIGEDSPVYGVYRRDNADIYVTNNVIENRLHTSGANSFYAVYVEGPGPAYVLHNSFINRNEFMQARLIEHGPDTDLYVTNNIFYGNGISSELAYSSSLDTSPAEWNNNIFFGLNMMMTAVNQWSSMTGLNAETWAENNVFVDPALDVQDVAANPQPDWYAPTLMSPDALTIGGSTIWLNDVPEDRLGAVRSAPVSIGPFQVEQNTAASAAVYVAHPAEGGNDLNLGTEEYPLATITAAIARVEAMGTVFVGPGLFVETVLVNKEITLEGSGDDTILRASPGDGTSLNLTAAGATARYLQVRPGDTGTRAAVRLGNQNTTIEYSLITEDPNEPNGTTLRGITAVSAGAHIRNNRIVLADTTHEMSTRYAINPTEAAAVDNPGIIEGNHIYFGNAPGAFVIGIQANDYYIIRNNVIQQGGTGTGATFNGIRVILTDNNSYQILHNTIVNTNAELNTVRLITIDNLVNPVISNNVLLSSGNGTAVHVSGAGQEPSELHNNLMWGATLLYDGFADINTLVGLNDLPYAQDNVNIDPQLLEGILGGNDWWAPSLNSPVGLTEGGTDAWLGVVPEDILGNPRSVPVSIGAYEVD